MHGQILRLELMKTAIASIVAGLLFMTAISSQALSVQPPAPIGLDKAKKKSTPNPKTNPASTPGGAPPKVVRQPPNRQDSMEKAASKVDWPAKVRFKVASFDNAPLAATYYPAKTNMNAPVVLLVHELNQTSRDFENEVEELKGLSLAEHLQKEGYAVLLFDLRGQGNSKGPSLQPQELQKPQPDPKATAKPNSKKTAPNRKPAPAPAPVPPPNPNSKKVAISADPKAPKVSKDLASKLFDLQAIHTFLIDRHNRGELNISKLAVLALGDGGNLVATWAIMNAQANNPDPNARSDSKTAPRLFGDISALILVSPQDKLEELDLRNQLKSFSQRIPVFTVAADGDKVSADLVNNSKLLVERHPNGRSELIADSSLKGSKLIRYEKSTVQQIQKFLESTIRFKTADWEPRYNLTPVATTKGEFVSLRKASEPAAKSSP